MAPEAATTIPDDEAVSAASVDPAEIARFTAMAGEWWDPHGKFRPLHQLNPARIGFIRDRAAVHFGRDPLQPKPLAGLRLLDIGCGGGLICEPMTRLGARVVGADAAARNIAVAGLHAAQSGLAIDYRNTTAEALVEAGERFDLVLNLEVVEHVADRAAFIATCSALLRPGGMMVVATINRTLKAYAMAIVGAEYLLRWLPRGTHTFEKFVRPHELARELRAANLAVKELAGISYSPLADRWAVGRDLDVNYLAVAVK